MKISLITKDEHNILQDIYNNNPILTLQNKGYETIDNKLFTEENRKQITIIERILSKSIVGFIEFQNFKLNKYDKIVLRFQYNYGAEDNSHYFKGVGYILLDELLNGFNHE